MALHSYRTVLLGVDESTLRRVHEASGYRRGDFAPRHPTVDVVETLSSLVTIELIVITEARATASVLWNAAYQLGDTRASSLSYVVECIPRATWSLQPANRPLYGSAACRATILDPL